MRDGWIRCPPTTIAGQPPASPRSQAGVSAAPNRPASPTGIPRNPAAIGRCAGSMSTNVTSSVHGAPRPSAVPAAPSTRTRVSLASQSVRSVRSA